MNCPGSRQVVVFHHHPCANHQDLIHLKILVLLMHRLRTTIPLYFCRCVPIMYKEYIMWDLSYRYFFFFSPFTRIIAFYFFCHLWWSTRAMGPTFGWKGLVLLKVNALSLHGSFNSKGLCEIQVGLRKAWWVPRALSSGSKEIWSRIRQTPRLAW